MPPIENPLVSDAQLQRLLADVDNLQSEAAFLSWRKSFLKSYEQYLDPDGVMNAKDANYRLLKQLMGLVNRGLRVKTLIRNRNIHSPDEVTAEGRRALTNLSDELKLTEQAIHDFLPRTSADEERIGYDKFELGAVLIQDGFHGYDLMIKTREYVEKTTHTKLDGIVDDNFLKIFMYYSNELDSFAQVMEDLGLFKIMKKCVDAIYSGKERPKPKVPKTRRDDEVEMDATKSNGINGKDPDCIQNGSQHGGKNETNGRESSVMNGSNSSGQKTRGGTINAFSSSHHNLPRSKPKGREIEDENHDAPEADEEDEPPPEDGQGGEPQYLIYFDPKTNTIGQIERNECGAKSQLLIDVTKQGIEAYQGIIEDEREKQDIIWLLKKMEKTQPTELSWLDKIKKEKAEAKKKAGGVGAANKKTVNMKSTGSSTRSVTNRDSMKSQKMPEKPGFRNIFDAGESASSSTKKMTVEDYQGKYKKVAPKPESGGWRKLS